MQYVDQKCERLALSVQIPNDGQSLESWTCFEVMSQHYLGGTEKTMGNLSQDPWSYS